MALIDPLAPPEDDAEIWERLDAAPPTLVVVLKPDHVRDVDLFVRRYGARAYGPSLFWRARHSRDGARGGRARLEAPGRARGALRRARPKRDAALGCPSSARSSSPTRSPSAHGELRVWGTPWHEERVLPALRALLDLPFEHVIVSHGEPVHDRAAFERALELPAFGP